MINTVVVIYATKIMNLFRNGCVHNVKKLIFLRKSLAFSIIKFIFAASFGYIYIIKKLRELRS